MMIRPKILKPHPHKSKLAPRRLTNLRLPKKPRKKPERKKKEKGIKENKTNKKEKTVAPP